MGFLRILTKQHVCPRKEGLQAQGTRCPPQVLRDDRCCHHIPQGPHWILRQAILKYICANYKVDAAKAAVQVRLALKRGVAKGSLKMARASGKGAGSYKVVKAEKPKKVKKA